MIQKPLASRVYFRVCCFVVYFVVASASFSGYYDKWHFGEEGVAGEDPRFHFEMMVDGTAHRPYVYRQLLPTAANWMDRAVPASIKTWLYGHQTLGTEAAQDAFFDSATAENPVYFFRYLLVYLATFGFALLGLYAMQMVCRAVQVPLPAAVIAPTIVLLLVPYLQSCGGYFYDYPELAFFALAAWFALKFDWWWILPIAVLGTWNKESFVLFVPTLYPLLRRRSSRLNAGLGIGVLFLACLAVYLSVRSGFAHNPGGLWRCTGGTMWSISCTPGICFSARRRLTACKRRRRILWGPYFCWPGQWFARGRVWRGEGGVTGKLRRRSIFRSTFFFAGRVSCAI